MNWIHFTQPDQLHAITERSHNVPCLIFKHSTRCSISSIAKFRLEKNWSFSEEKVVPYFLDLIANRQVSNEVADKLEVYHESPQIILVSKGEVLLDASHLDISVEEIREVLQ